MSTETKLPFESTPDSLASWLASLPLKDRDRYVALFSGLQALNEVNPEPGFYLVALEKFRKPVFEATSNLTTAFLGKPLPLDTGIRKLAKLSAQFQAELAQGYYAITQAKGFSRIFGLEEQGKIIHRALRSYAQMLLRLALMYQAPPSSTWLRLHEIYRLAQRADLLRWAGPCSELAYPAPCTIEQLYLRALAFRLAAPYRLSQDDIQRVFDSVQQHGGLLSVSQEPAEENRKADFWIDLDSGGGPFRLSQQQVDKQGKDVRYLFLTAFRRMLVSLGRTPFDKKSGFSLSLSNHLQVRLGGTLDFLPDNKSRNSILFADYKNLVSAITWRGAKLNFKLQSLDEHMLPVGSGSSKTSGTFLAPSEAVKPTVELFEGRADISTGVACTVYRSNASGFYLIESPGLKLRASQLVGLFTDDKLIQFGQIYLGCNEANPNIYGFELLASQLSVVRVSFDSAPKKSYKCFLSDLDDGHFSLITEPLRLRGGDGISIDEQGHGIMMRYRLTKLLERTAEFCQYEIVSETSEQPY